jgi:transposase
MMSNTPGGVEVIGGVDTHAAMHCAAAITADGQMLGHAEFAASTSGYEQLLEWLKSYGRLVSVGVEGTGSYGAGLARVLDADGVTVFEVARPERRVRAMRGKSDSIDAEAAARAVLGGTATAVPKRSDGTIEAIRQLRLARSGAVKAKTAALNSLHALVVTAPAPLREELEGLPRQRRLARCASFRPHVDALTDPFEAAKFAMRSVARRALALQDEADVKRPGSGGGSNL